MVGLGVLIDVLLAHPDAGAVTALAAYLAFEVRLGRIQEIRLNQQEARQERRILGVTVYAIVKSDDTLDEGEFRRMLWGDEEEFFPRDLNAQAQHRMRRERGDNVRQKQH